MERIFDAIKLVVITLFFGGGCCIILLVGPIYWLMTGKKTLLNISYKLGQKVDNEVLKMINKYKL